MRNPMPDTQHDAGRDPQMRSGTGTSTEGD